MKNIRFFWDWRQWDFWGFLGPVCNLPYHWRLFLGPLCIAKVATHKPWRLTRQQRRYIARQRVKKTREMLRRVK